jgi:hypothetical protein
MSTDPNVIIKDSALSQYHHCRPKCLSWSAIFAGAIVGIGLTFLLNLFCVSIGLSIVKTSAEGVTALAVGGFIGLLISIIVAMFAAGMTAGYLARPFCFKRNLGVLYGFIAWCLALVLGVLLAAHMTRYVASYTEYVNNRPAVVNVVNNDVSPAVTVADKTTQSDVTVNAQKAVNNLGYSAFVIFVLFFVGALSSCFGGHCGMVCKCKYEECCDDSLQRRI